MAIRIFTDATCDLPASYALQRDLTILPMTVSLNGTVVGQGAGRSKKRAEQMAAKAAVEKLFPQKV